MKFCPKVLFNHLINYVLLGLSGLILISFFINVEGANEICTIRCEEPTVNDPNLKVEILYQGNFTFKPTNLSPVSSMTFAGTGQILLLDKNNGIVYSIANNSLIGMPILDVNVSNQKERGLLGVEAIKDFNNVTYVYLYYTESRLRDGSDVCPPKWYSNEFHCIPDNEPWGNRIYKYELRDNMLINPRLLLDLPAGPSPTHNGGVLRVGPDKNLYFTIGDMLGGTDPSSRTSVQNLNATKVDGRSGILRLTQDGKAVGEGILGKSNPLNLYYAYGIRNSFGLDFDPVTGKLWDTENGPEYGDEINLVEAGFNSGYQSVQGIWSPLVDKSPNAQGLIAGNLFLNPTSKLVTFGGKGIYSAPEFIWKVTVAPTAIKFLDSNALGEAYKNDLFVGSVKLGLIFHFDLNPDRTGLKLPGSSLNDKIADTYEEQNDLIFAGGMGLITDIDVGPDGYLYVLSNYKGKPTIFRITPVAS